MPTKSWKYKYVQKKVFEQIPDEGGEYFGEKAYTMVIVGSNQDAEPRTDLEELGRCEAVVDQNNKKILFLSGASYPFLNDDLEYQTLSKECMDILQAHVNADL